MSKKTDFEVWKNKKDICPKNNVAEIYFIMDRFDLCFSCYIISGDTSDMYRFFNRKLINNMWFCHFCLFPVGKYVNFLVIPGYTIKYRFDLFIMKYISAILQMASIMPHAWKYLFLIDTHCKRQNVFSDILKITRIFWSLLGVVLGETKCFLCLNFIFQSLEFFW